MLEGALPGPPGAFTVNSRRINDDKDVRDRLSFAIHGNGKGTASERRGCRARCSAASHGSPLTSTAASPPTLLSERQKAPISRNVT
jgi:hypothetical protein